VSELVVLVTVSGVEIAAPADEDPLKDMVSLSDTGYG
jgi:hypothetical protein